MTNWRYCVEHDDNGKLVYRMSDSKEVCIKYCDEKAKTMGKNESYVLFRCIVDTDGKFAGGPRQIIQVWMHDDEE